MSRTITIANPQILQLEKELILVPREEYEALCRIRQKGIAEINLTAKQKRSFRKSEQELKKGDYLTLNELESYLARPSAKIRR